MRLRSIALTALFCVGGLVSTACAGSGNTGANPAGVLPGGGKQASSGSRQPGAARRPSIGPSCSGTSGTAFLGYSGTNSATGSYSVVGGGQNNEACDNYDALVGGQNNTVAGGWAFDGAGADNVVAGSQAAVVGGFSNTASASYAFIGAGQSNNASASDSVIGGGDTNNAIAQYAVIGGGTHNTVSGEGAYIASGGYNVASGEGAVVNGGFDGTAGGTFATIPGGYRNSAAGTYSFAAGAFASAAKNGSFVWSDGSNGSTLLTASRSYQFLVRASGGFTLYSNAAATVGAQLAAGSRTWSSLSDRNAKTDIAPLNEDAVLAKVATLPISRWSYKTEHGVRHVGPMAQDFYAAFGVGEDDRHITSIDEDGIALAAIKALHAENGALHAYVESLGGQTTALRGENARLHRELAAIKLTRSAHDHRVDAALARLEARTVR